MAVSPTGTFVGTDTVYQLTAGLKQDVSQLITLLSPVETPLLNGTNFNDYQGLLIGVGDPAQQKKFEWIEEDILLPSAVATATITSVATTLTVGNEHQRKFRVGDVCRVSDTNELIRVTAYVSTDQLTITRGFGGSTAAAITTSTSNIRALGVTLAEGSDPGASVVNDRLQPFNFTRIYGPYKLQMSRTAQKVGRWGVPDEFAKQLMNRTKEFAMIREQDLLYGIRFDDTTNFLRTSGGIDYWIRNNGIVDSASTALTETAIQSNLLAGYNRGHVPTHLLANPQRLATLNSLTDTGRVRQEVVDGVRGRAKVTFVTTEFGDVQVVRSRYIDLKEAYLISASRIKRRILDTASITPLAKTGDSDSVMWVAEEGLEYRGAYQDAMFSGLTTN